MSDHIEGIWNGQGVRFKRNFRGYEITDEEAEVLLNGGEIKIKNLTSKEGNTYHAVCNLAPYEYKGREYVGVNYVRSFNPDIPPLFAKHVFTDEETDKLRNGETISLTDCVSKNGKNFTCNIKWGKNEFNDDAIVFVK